jgi:glycosyltransferase involved in cell wall biosynthesis
VSDLISVIIPTYNREVELSRALSSLVSQTYRDWEAIVVDNNSADFTENIVRSMQDERIKFYKVSNNGVVAFSRNFGIEKSIGKYIAFLDSDDWWTPKKLEISYYYLTRGFDLVYHDMYLVKSNFKIKPWNKARTRQLKQDVFKDLIQNGQAINNSSVVLKKELLDKIGGISESIELIGIEDYDLWLKISKVTNAFKRISGVYGYYWIGGGNLTNNKLTLSTVDAIRDKYQIYFDQDVDTNWIEYIKGRVYFKEFQLIKSKKHLVKITFSKESFYMYLKSKYMILLILLKTSFKDAFYKWK